MDVTKNRSGREDARLGADDWVDAALDAIADSGVAAVTVEGLARKLSVTKGSFYWHFESQAALLGAALARWEARDTEGVIDAAASGGPRERLHALFVAVHRPARGAALHVALSAAADHPVVQPYLRRVSQRRIAYMERCLLELGLGASDARSRATLAYAAYVGFLHLGRESPDSVPRGRALAAYRDHFIATLLPPAP